MGAKLVLSRGKFESSKQALYDLHWLPIKARITFKLLTVMYNCTVGNAPEYLTELLSKQNVRREGLRSNKNQNTCYMVPSNKRKTFSDRSFSTAGPKLWNSLPESIRQSASCDRFKKNLKTHYFRNFYSLF